MENRRRKRNRKSKNKSNPKIIVIKQRANKEEDKESKALIPMKKILRERFLNTSLKLLIIAIIIVIATYAWFTTQKDSKVDTLDAKIVQSNEVSVSLDGGKTWSQEANLNIDTDFTLYSEVTSDGLTFYKANSKNTKGTPLNFVKAEGGVDYLEFQILVKSLMPTNIYLEKKSEVIPACGLDTDKLLNSKNVVRESSEGNFSRDLIAGAVRVAIIEDDLINEKYVPQNKTKLVWAPNKGYQIKAEENKLVAYLDSKELQSYKYIKVTNATTFEEADVPNLRDEIKASYDELKCYDDPVLTSIQEIDENDESKNVRSLTVRVWIEGNDREAIYSLKGGLFQVNLSFVGISDSYSKTQV